MGRVLESEANLKIRIHWFVDNVSTVKDKICNWSSAGRDWIWNGDLLPSSSLDLLGFSNKALEYLSNRRAAARVCLCRSSFLVRVYCRSSSKLVAELWKTPELLPELLSLDSTS